MKLPELEIPVFDGDKIKWKQFWDFFKVTVDQNERLSDIEKLNYLKSMLKGGAQEVISGLILSHENYQVAKLLLVNRFEDDQVVLHFHFTQLINLAPARNTSKGLRLVFDKVESHLRSLEALQQDINHDVFVSIISSKIPKDVFLQLELQKGVKNKWSVSLLRELFNNYICAAERADEFSNCSKANNTTESQVIRDRPWERHSINPKLFIQCKYCDGNHWSDHCMTYKSAKDRKLKLKDSCFLCLKRGNIGYKCLSNKSWFYCGRVNHHNRSICPHRFAVKETTQ